MSGLTMYLIVILDGVSNTLEVLAFICGTFSVISLGLCFLFKGIAEADDDKEALKMSKLAGRIGKTTAPWAIAFILLHAFVPGSKGAAAIWLVPRLVESGDIEQIRGEMGDTWELVQGYLREKISAEMPATTEGESDG